MPNIDSSRFAMVRLVGLSQPIHSEFREAVKNARLSQNNFCERIVRRSDFGELVAKGLPLFQGAGKRGTGRHGAAVWLPRDVVEVVKEAARSLEMSQQEVLSCALFALRGAMAKEVFATP